MQLGDTNSIAREKESDDNCYLSLAFNELPFSLLLQFAFLGKFCSLRFDFLLQLLLSLLLLQPEVIREIVLQTCNKLTLIITDHVPAVRTTLLHAATE